MKFFVKVKPGARKDAVEKTDATHLAVSVRARAKDGKANEAIEELLAKYFGVAKSRVRITHGSRSRNKIVTVAM